MTKIIIRTAKEKVYFEPPKEDAEKLINSWVNGMQLLIKRLEGKPKKITLYGGNRNRANSEKISTSVL